MTTLAVVSAGLRSPSTTRMLADDLAAQARNALLSGGVRDAEVVHFEVRDHAHALADALLTGFPTGGLKEALASVAAADGLIVVTPTFGASFSGLFKTFFDVLEPDALRGKPVLLAATGGTERHSLMLEHALRPLFSYLGAEPVRTAVYAATADFGGTESPDLAARVVRAGAELAAALAATGAAPRPAPHLGEATDPDLPAGFVPFDQLLKPAVRARRD